MDAKKKLCAAASSFITDNMTLFLAASTTVECIVPLLLGYKNLTVITNSPDIPKMLIGSNINVYSTGGKFLHHSNAYVGEFARNVIRSFNADLLFFSASGVTENGKITVLTGDDDIQKTMMENAAKTCFLFDNTKFGKTYRHTICTLKDVDIVITDKEISSLPNANNIIIAR
jgi:DeoR family myo-inositol catabolism operon transcriptional repressor